MDQKRLDFLNLMARLDREDPFLDEGTESLQTINFDSIEDAASAFESTLAMRDSIKSQAVANQIPEAWIERIQNFSDEPTREPAPSLVSLLGTWLESTRDSIFGQPQYWGAGLATAGVLAIMFAPFGGQVGGPGLGGGIQNPTLPSGVGGTPATSASLSTEENQELGPGARIDFYSTLPAEGGITGLSVPTEESDESSEDCGTALEVNSTETRKYELSGHCLEKPKEESP